MTAALAETVQEVGMPQFLAVTAFVAILAMALVWIGAAMDGDD